ncbi:MAG TPA: adenylyltransferase/cytidyltransferase family protein, partial [Longimicrobium sp.]
MHGWSLEVGSHHGSTSVMTDPADKVLGREELLARLRRPRSARVVFTNGVFDVLHRGHVDYLARARALGDLLV